MIVAVIVVQTSAAGLLRKAGWSEGTLDIFPLILFASGHSAEAADFGVSRTPQKAKQAERSTAGTASRIRRRNPEPRR